MSAKNAFGYYLLKRAQQHLMQEGALDAAFNGALSVAKDQLLTGKLMTNEEQELVLAICNYQRWEDVPDEQPIGQCIAGGAR